MHIPDPLSIIGCKTVMGESFTQGLPFIILEEVALIMVEHHDRRIGRYEFEGVLNQIPRFIGSIAFRVISECRQPFLYQVRRGGLEELCRFEEDRLFTGTSGLRDPDASPSVR